jgi:hypothetical protein
MHRISGNAQQGNHTGRNGRVLLAFLDDLDSRLQSEQVADHRASNGALGPKSDLPPVEIASREYLEVYSDLTREAARRKKSLQHRLSDILAQRSRDRDGRDIFSTAEAVAYGEAFGCTAHQVRRALTAGNGEYWHYAPEHDTWQRVGQRTLAKRWGMTSVGRKVAMPIEAYAGSVKDYNALAFKVWLSAQKNKAPTRAQLMTWWGVSRQTLRAWEKRAGITVRRRIAVCDVPENWQEWREINQNKTGRVWLVVFDNQDKQIVAKIRFMDTHNQPIERIEKLIQDARDNLPARYYQQVERDTFWGGKGEIKRHMKPRYAVMLAWQDSNEYFPGDVPEVKHGAGRHIRKELRAGRPDVVDPGRTQTRTPAPTVPRPKRFDTERAADKWQAKHRDVPAKFYRVWHDTVPDGSFKHRSLQPVRCHVRTTRDGVEHERDYTARVLRYVPSYRATYEGAANA